MRLTWFFFLGLIQGIEVGPVSTIVGHVDNTTYSSFGILPDTAIRDDVPNIILRHKNCTDLSKIDMTAVAKVYPQVIINCELEKSTLIPEEIYSHERGKPDERHYWRPRSGQMKFIELSKVTELNTTVWRQPVFPCVKPTGAGKGSFEASVTLISLLRMSGGLAKGFKFFVSGLATSGSITFLGELTYSVACNYKDSSVRPVAEISTVTTIERFRRLSVDINAKDAIKYQDWEESSSVVINPNSVMFSCVSEQQVPDICSWSDVELQNEAEKHLFRQN